MNENEMGRIAAAANALRPDWPIKSVLTILEKPFLSNRTRRDVAVAIAWVACESDSKTPARILEAGPWWQASQESGQRAPRNPQPHEECPKHEGQFRWSCGGCAADRKAKRDEADEQVRQQQALSRTASLERIRATLTEARADHCPHGVARDHCADHDPRRQADPETETQEDPA